MVFPEIKLSKKAVGKEIAEALGDKLPAVAAWYGHTEAKFRELLREEESLQADTSGRLLYLCEVLPPAEPPPGGGAVATPSIPPYPIANTFYLHSRPGCKKIVYLDFTGHTTSGTAWNAEYANGADIVTPVYDIDGTPNAFSAQEFTNMQLIWQRVAEDFAPFEVDVTTEDPMNLTNPPSLDLLVKTSPTDDIFGQRVCIGGSYQSWLGQPAGGVAYYGTFSEANAVDTPTFVFPANLGSGDPRYVGEAVSHEVGHTLGLRHDGTLPPLGALAGGEYYFGNTDWAPIMGGSYYANITQWSKGEYANANNLQDDMAIIAATIPFRAKTVGDSISNATVLSGINPSATGLIARSTDVDVFGFTTAAGNLTFNLAPAPPSGNLFAQVTLYDKTGNPLMTATPTSTLTGAVSLTASVAEGTYYLAVDGVGYLDPLSTGFSDYGSVGQYTLSSSLNPAMNSIPPIANAQSSTPRKGVAPLTVNFSSAGSNDPDTKGPLDLDGLITGYTWNFGDTEVSTVANPAHIYTVPGDYTASLRVKDNTADTSEANTVAIHVAASNAIYVDSIVLNVIPVKDKEDKVTATVTVKDAYGNLIHDVEVKGSWSGLISSGSKTEKTDSAGNATFDSKKTKKTGAVFFTVSKLKRKNYVFDPVMNTTSMGSINVN